jgi:hypothetical protein
MHHPKTRQLVLPFVDENDPGQQLPKENRDRCRALLARILLQLIRIENEERGSHEHREDSSQPS